MMGLSPDQLAWMRTQLAEVLPDTCVITAPSRTPDGAGGFTTVYAPIVGGTVPCRIDPMERPRFVEAYGGREGLVNLYLLTLPYNAPVDIDQRMVISGVNYEVRETHKNPSWSIDQRLIVAELK